MPEVVAEQASGFAQSGGDVVEQVFVQHGPVEGLAAAAAAGTGLPQFDLGGGVKGRQQ